MNPLSTEKSLAELVRDLPPDEQAIIREFVEFLLARQKMAPAHLMRQDWAGGLRAYRNQFSAIELQKKSLDWLCEG